MTTIELEAKKAELAKRILTENNESVINKVMDYFTKVKKTANPPCQYTLEELKLSVREAEEEIRYGRLTNQEDVFDEIEKKLAE